MQPEKIKVLYIDGSVGFGGAPKSLSLVLREMKRVEPIILTSTRSDVRDKWFGGARVYRMGRISNYYLKIRAREWLESHVPVAGFRKAALKAFVVLDLLERWVNLLRILVIARRYRVRLIHMNTACFPPEGLYAARILGIPSIAHLRGFITNREPVFVNALRSASVIIGISEAISKSIYPVKDPQYVTLVYDPVDIQLFDRISGQEKESRRSLGLSNADIAVGIFGRVISWKGQREFVRACIEVMGKNPNVKAFIVGDSSDSAPTYLKEIKKIISESGFEDRFILTGYREDVERLYFAMDIIVHASIEPEPFGMVVPEGMAARKPVIATDAGGPSEVIESGVDGILVPPGNVGKMSSAILDLANDPSKRQRIGEKGYQKAKARFTIKAAAAKIEKLYFDLVPSVS
jgi:glycosyltransferase involved in cell wall biosynthesis